MLLATLFDYIFIQYPKMRKEQAEMERKEEEEETCCMEVDDGTGVKHFPTSDEKKPLLDESRESNKEWKPYEPGE